MKTVGLVGGMSWYSTQEYYRIINEEVEKALGTPHSAKCLIYSIDLAELDQQLKSGDWAGVASLMTDAAQRLERGGADFIAYCSNTVHKVSDQVQNSITIPIIHIADATAEKIKAQGLKTVGLLGTKYTMADGFYQERLARVHGIDAVVPDEEDMEAVNAVIYDELCSGNISYSSKGKFIGIIESLTSRGAKGIILGCTEIPMLVTEKDTPVPLFDTTAIHAHAAAKYALG